MGHVEARGERFAQAANGSSAALEEVHAAGASATSTECSLPLEVYTGEPQRSSEPQCVDRELGARIAGQQLCA